MEYLPGGDDRNESSHLEWNVTAWLNVPAGLRALCAKWSRLSRLHRVGIALLSISTAIE